MEKAPGHVMRAWTLWLGPLWRMFALAGCRCARTYCELEHVVSSWLGRNWSRPWETVGTMVTDDKRDVVQRSREEKVWEAGRLVVCYSAGMVQVTYPIQPETMNLQTSIVRCIAIQQRTPHETQS